MREEVELISAAALEIAGLSCYSQKLCLAHYVFLFLGLTRINEGLTDRICRHESRDYRCPEGTSPLGVESEADSLSSIDSHFYPIEVTSICQSEKIDRRTGKRG